MSLAVLPAVQVRRPPGGGHVLYGLSHAPLWVLILFLVVLVALVVYASRRP